ncbi:cobalt ECF transporter T component CbiQ [Acetivibrio mesophilus]|uniref:Cobalt ECF transporter T component CbiQ n=1 Tax=Acetivibrio mesophilus TaxID=2487273 RepID=A0A4Q0I2W8_9FIRM|nr:cobalt ECF transporter T component CbiQ [Acetivibrio mesophilus]RXE58573.1 cobalt ECF transporter T component CbiQ [Acetivibrio mesophilus]
MSSISNSLYNIEHLDDLARKETFVHKLHPLVKLIVTLAFLTMVASFGRYEIERLLPLFLYPVIIITLAELPIAPIFKRLLIVEPFIIGIGILNPFFEKKTFVLAGLTLSTGWITFLSIFIKSGLTVASVLLLVATTGMDRLAAALRMLRIPRLFVLQLLLTYRYISVLMEEAERMLRAYALRSPLQKGIHISDWGSFAGQLVLRTFDRAQRVYRAMCVRGFTGEYNTGEHIKFKMADILYLVGWLLFFVVTRMYNIPMLIGTLFTGVIK